MKKILFTVCLTVLSVCAFAENGTTKKEAKESVTKLAQLVELGRATGTIESKCGVTWNFIIHFNTPAEAVQDLREIKAQIDSACGTDKTFFVS